ncbi:MAG: 2-C-methyl-D-erythritol 2,4-cyclodiphosphate synthase [Bradymonadales bacterium]|nr:MAG: 2-C-methyl-D-erythritol 2,4-cyclodiphosphate synthase [Bradymonadales bacterium]
MWNRLRIGSGIDAHAFEEGRELWIGGVQIPFKKGLAGHSDADVLIHAVVDAILGAMGGGDIGTHFPSSDPKWAGVSSTEFLSWTRNELQRSSYELISLDVVVIAQEPKLALHIPQIRERMCELLGLSLSRLSVKATTTDFLGFVGRKEGIVAQAHCLLLAPESRD